MKKITIYLIAGLFSTFLFSCEQFLDEKPEQAIAVEDAITSLSDAQVALNGCYDGLQEIELFARDFLVISDLAADNSKMNAQNAGRFVNIYQWTFSATEGYGTGIWNLGYNTMYRLNKLIQDVSAFTDVDEADQQRILGEAKTIRALLYFAMVNYFGQTYNYTSDASHLGVPLITEPIGVDEKPGRATVAQVYAQILLDLEGNGETPGAIDMLGSGSSAFYIDAYAAMALASRVHLYMENWEEARDYAMAVINSGKYALVPTGSYINSWSTDEHSEQIFYLRFTEVDNWSVDMLGQMYMEAGYGDILATEDLLGTFDAGDVRLGWFRDADGITFIEKFPGRTRVGVDNHPLIRYAEMYLNAAEAEAELGNDAAAQALVGEIASRAGASDILESGAALLTRIRSERRKELCYEGHRLWDLERWNMDIVRTDLTSPNIISVIEYPDYRFAYPIPDREIQVNPVIAEQQNPGY